jgi:hypothetical protein
MQGWQACFDQNLTRVLREVDENAHKFVPKAHKLNEGGYSQL